MSAPDIDDAFVTQFESEAHIEYQQMGSKLRNTVRTKQGVVGSSTTFQVIGNAAVGSKSREGNIPCTSCLYVAGSLFWNLHRQTGRA